MQERLPPPVFDSLVLAAVADEIARELSGARVAAVAQPDAHTIALRVRAGRSGRAILCSMHPRRARCLIAPMPEGRADHPFPLQLRARLEGGRLRAATVDPFERVLTLRFETLEGEVDLIVEVMGRHSNLLLVDGDRIAGVFKPVTPAMSRVRPLHPGGRYARPPRSRPTPAEVEEGVIETALAEGRPVAATLVGSLLGISPPVAVHLALEAGLDPGAPAPAEAAAALRASLAALVEVVETRAFAPVWYADAAGRPAAYAAIPLLTYRTLAAHALASMSAAAGRVIEVDARRAVVEEQRHSLLSRIDDAMRRVERAEGEVQTAMDEASDAPRWRRWGELLLAYASTVPTGADRVTVPDFDGTPVTIPLHPRRTPVANAQAYFRRHGKAATAGRILPRRLATLREERAYLDQVRLFAAQAASAEEVRALAAELSDSGGAGPRGRETGRTPRRGASRGRRLRPEARPAPRIFTTADGLRILVGRSSRENDHVTFTLGAPDDLWLHARGMPGAHVILKTDGGTPAPEAVATAAAVAAYFSQGRGAAKVPVDVTARRHVRKPKGARPGMVTYREEQTVMAEPRLPVAADPDEEAARWDR